MARKRIGELGVDFFNYEKPELTYKFRDIKLDSKQEREIIRHKGIECWYIPASIIDQDDFYGENGVKYENIFKIPILFEANEYENETSLVQTELGLHFPFENSINIRIHKEDFNDFIRNPMLAKNNDKYRDYSYPVEKDLILIKRYEDEEHSEWSVAERFLEITYADDDSSFGTNNYSRKNTWNCVVKMKKFNQETFDIEQVPNDFIEQKNINEIQDNPEKFVDNLKDLDKKVMDDDLFKNDFIRSPHGNDVLK